LHKKRSWHGPDGTVTNGNGLYGTDGLPKRQS